MVTLIATIVRLFVITLGKQPAAPQFLAAGILVYHLGISAIEVGLLYQFTLGTVMFCVIYCYLSPQQLGAIRSSLPPKRNRA